MASWHFWLTVSGFTAMAVGLTAAGFVQGCLFGMIGPASSMGIRSVDAIRRF
ncbi:MAG: hypothetical protein ACXWV7_09400 [Nitrospira sp.]